MTDIGKILEAAERGGRPVSEELLPLVYDELKSLAARRMAREAPGQTLQATALVHEAWINLTKDQKRTWNDRAHFFRAAALAMRRILVGRARAKARIKHGGNDAPLSLSELEIVDETRDDCVIQVDEMLGHLEQEDPDSARVITLKFFGGLTNAEIARLDGVAERTVERKWTYAKTRLYQLICEERAR
jgi:RNA polymerase sigma factor (TIGR02999 family)